MAADDKILKDFVRQVRLRHTVNFPLVARELGVDWLQDIKPALTSTPWFRPLIENVLDEIKYELYDKILDVGSKGKVPGGGSPEITYINAIIKHIDSGALLDKSVDEEAPKTDASKLQELLTRLDNASQLQPSQENSPVDEE